MRAHGDGIGGGGAATTIERTPILAANAEPVVSDAVATAAETGEARQRRLETLLSTIRLSRRVATQTVMEHSAVVEFASTVLVGGRVIDLRLAQLPGLFDRGTHRIGCEAVIDQYVVSGHFTIDVGGTIVEAASWNVVNGSDVGGLELLPFEIAVQLPRSSVVPALAGASLRRAVRRVHSNAALAGAQLLSEHRGLVRSVVNRYRSVVAGEDASIDLNDLMLVGDHQLLDVAERYFCDPERQPPRDVAWSKIVQRAVGNAVRAEIARVTGISVEFRQLLAWFHSRPADREAPVEEVAYRMAHAAGVTRLLAQRTSFDRSGGAVLLDEMLGDGRAAYVAHGRDAGTQRRALRRAGVFVISPRSSLAEIQRAQEFAGPAQLAIQISDEHGTTVTDETILARLETGFEETESRDCLRRTIEESGLSKLEALVWLHRSGALDPSGHGTELPEIADDLGLDGRSEARAALRRARRKLDAWSAGPGRLGIAG